MSEGGRMVAEMSEQVEADWFAAVAQFPDAVLRCGNCGHIGVGVGADAYADDERAVCGDIDACRMRHDAADMAGAR